MSDTKLALDKIKVNKATGPDRIPPWALKECSHLLAAPVTAIFNSSLREGVLPKLWKTATIIPVSKKHPPVTIENDIRPISLTPIIAKVFESLVLKWVDYYVKPQIDDKQYGGMAGTCTTDALVEMLHKWYESTDVTGNFVRVLFLDYSKAFDLINHDILLNKMTGMEVPAHLVRWMAAFLLDREQRVKIGNAVSKPGYPNGGFLQGTLSGPKHFLVHINDLQTPCPIYKYVDDSTIFEICNQDMVSVIQDSADLVEQWSCNNDMRINTTKTKEMVICFRRDSTFVDSLPYIYMNGHYIERVSQAKVLGVTISSDLSWNAHVDEIISKARKRVYMIYQLKRAGINQNDLIRIYVSVIRPVVEYACPVWHTNLPKYLSDNIEIIQKRCLKTIFPGYQYENILQMVNLPTLHRRRDELCKVYFAKMKSNDHKLNALLPNGRSVPYSLRVCNKLPIPRAKTNRYKNSLIPWCLEHFQIG